MSRWGNSYLNNVYTWAWQAAARLFHITNNVLVNNVYRRCLRQINRKDGFLVVNHILIPGMIRPVIKNQIYINFPLLYSGGSGFIRFLTKNILLNPKLVDYPARHLIGPYEEGGVNDT